MKRNYLSIALNMMCVATVATFTACSKGDIGNTASSENGGSGTERGGSMARFAISGDYLYTLDNPVLVRYDIGDIGKIIYDGIENSLPEYVNGETVHVRDSLLYVGSSNGMFVYDKMLHYLGGVSHFYSCDPVVVQDTLAFVTLNRNSTCRFGGGLSELQIYSVKDPRSPKLMKSYRYDIEAPQGLALLDSVLFVCDKGIKVFDARNPLERLPMLQHLSKDETGNPIDGYDVILLDDGTTAIMVGSTGLFQYRYTLTPSGYKNWLELKMTLISSIVPAK